VDHWRALAVLLLELLLMAVSVLLILALAAIASTVVIVVSRSASRKTHTSSSGGDIVAYLVMALAMGVAGFALARLAGAAFPGGRLVFTPAEEVANSVAALVVSVPFLVYFWQRQAKRRVQHPTSAGWTVYLSLIELVFMTAFVVTAVMFLSGMFGDGQTHAWTSVLVFGAILVFHEHASRVTPSLSDAGELPRVIGSAISLVTVTVGLLGVLDEVFEVVFRIDSSLELHPWLAMLVIGAPIWWYRWVRPWASAPALPRTTWTVIVSVGSLAATLGAATALVTMVARHFLGAAGSPFRGAPPALAIIITGVLAFAIHRRELGRERSSPVQLYEYAMAALGLATAVATASALTIATFSRSLIVGGTAGDVISLGIVVVAGLAVWLVFDVMRSGAVEVPSSWPRRLYTLGLGAVFGLVSASALIAVIFTILRRILATGTGGSLLEPGAIFLYSGVAAWYLLRSHARERGEASVAKAVAPFAVTIICSHPGDITTRFSEAARLRVIYRDDEAGVIDKGMAEEIVAAVDNRPSLVWVDETGFRVAPMRKPESPR
jgi:hypothetical protein